ncbi:hypothetical protein L7F22_046912 [Adiantum nelumboides]|nr:hypothetical protein [Adiantum nelumboides]
MGKARQILKKGHKMAARGCSAEDVVSDDLIIGGDALEDVEHVKSLLNKQFDMKDLGELRHFLGIDMIRNEGGIWLSQKKYGLDMLMKYGMANCKPISIPLDQNLKLRINDGEVLDDATMYHKIVGSLIYKMISWPDLSYAVGLLPAMAERNDVFCMLSSEDKLDGQQLSTLGLHDATCLGLKRSVEHCAGFTLLLSLLLLATGVRVALPIAEQICWDSKDSEAHAVTALSIKRNITPHIRSARTAKQAWDILAGLYAGQNEAKISYLLKELELKIMQEGTNMNVFLAEIKDLKEQLISVEEVIPDHSLVQIVLDALPKSYQIFASTWKLVTDDRSVAIKFDILVSKLLQEAQSRKK